MKCRKQKGWSWVLLGVGLGCLGGAFPASSLGDTIVLSSTANTIANPSFETSSAWVASGNSDGDHSEGYTSDWASAGSESYEFTRSAGEASAGSWVGISQTLNLTGVSGLVLDCRDTGIDGSNNAETLQFLVDGTVVGQWANDGWPIGTTVNAANSANWGHTATTDNIEIPFNTTFTGDHTLMIREYTAYSYDPLDPKVYMIDNIREMPAVPEPGSVALLLMAGLGLLAFAWRRRCGAKACGTCDASRTARQPNPLR